MTDQQSLETLRHHIQKLAEALLISQIKASGLHEDTAGTELTNESITRVVHGSNPAEKHTIKVSVQARADGDIILHCDTKHPNDEGTEAKQLILQVSKPDLSLVVQAVQKCAQWSSPA